MRVVGNQTAGQEMPELTAANLSASERLMASLRELVGGGRHFFPKGVYRYRSHAEADAAWIAAIARDMAELERERLHESGEVCTRRDC